MIYHFYHCYTVYMYHSNVYCMIPIDNDCAVPILAFIMKLKKKHKLNHYNIMEAYPSNNQICQQVEDEASIVRYTTTDMVLLIVGATRQWHIRRSVCVRAYKRKIGVFLIVCVVVISTVDLDYVGPYCHSELKNILRF